MDHRGDAAGRDRPLSAEDGKEAVTRLAIARREPLIRAGRLSVAGLVGEPDLLRREGAGYVAVDIGADAPGGAEGVLLRLALCTDILEHMGLSAGRHGYSRDAHGVEMRHELGRAPGPGVPCGWERYLRTRRAVREMLAAPYESRAASCAACGSCHWRGVCLDALRRARDLTLLPGVDRAARDALMEEFASVDDLAVADVEDYIDGDLTPFRGISAQALRRIHGCAVSAADQNLPLAPPPPNSPP